jgi:hypothetical protein
MNAPATTGDADAAAWVGIFFERAPVAGADGARRLLLVGAWA